jgi:hypothetical protein
MAWRCAVAQIWRNRVFMRRCVGVAVAYAVAIQMVLAGLGISHMAAADAAPVTDLLVICQGNGSSNDQGEPGGRPVQHQPPCILCTMALESPGILPVVTVSFSPLAIGGSILFSPTARVAVSRIKTPRLSQGPPQIV